MGNSSKLDVFFLEREFDTTKNNSINRKHLFFLVGEKIRNELDINHKDFVSILEKIKNTATEDTSGFYYSESIGRTEKKKSIDSNAEVITPNNIRVDIIELYKVNENINKLGEEEVSKKIIEAFNDDYDLFLFKTFQNFEKDYIDYDFKLTINNIIDIISKNKSKIDKNILKLSNFFDFLTKKDKLINFYRNYLKSFYIKQKKIIEQLDKTDEILKIDANIENFDSIVKKYNENKIEKLFLSSNLSDKELEVTTLFKNINLLSSFFKFVAKSNIVTILGDEDSGKDILALSLCLEANQKNYRRFFINLGYTNSSELKDIFEFFDSCLDTNYTKPFFVVLHGLNNINHNDFKEYIFTLKKLSENQNNIIIFTSEDNRDFGFTSVLKFPIIEKSIKVSIKYKESANYPSYINNLKLRLMYDEYNFSSVKSEKQIYFLHSYLKSSLKKIVYSNKYTEEDLLEDLKFSAYQVFIGNTISVSNKSVDFRKEIKKCSSLVTINENKLDQLTFNSKIIRDYLVSKYILSLLSESVDLLKTELEDQDINDYKWFNITILLSEELHTHPSFYKLLEKLPELISVVLNNLRQIKDNDLHNIFISKLKRKENTLTPKLLLEISKSYYRDYNYLESIKWGLISLKKNSDSYELYNHIASCCLDLFMPEYALYFCEKALNNCKNDLEKARVFGNKARAFLRKKDLVKAKEFFEMKKNIHERFKKHLDVIRDQSDLLMLNSFYGNNDFDFINTNHKKLLDIIALYDKNVLDTQIEQEYNKFYAYRNFSYFFPFLKRNKSIIEKDFFQNYTYKEFHKRFDYIYIVSYVNIAKSPILERKEANDYLDKAYNLLVDDKFHVEAFLALAYLLLNNSKHNYKDKINSHYRKFESIAHSFLKELNNSNLFDKVFSEEKFILKNDCTKEYLDSLIVF